MKKKYRQRRKSNTDNEEKEEWTNYEKEE